MEEARARRALGISPEDVVRRSGDRFSEMLWSGQAHSSVLHLPFY
jgi:hypothetical protein